MHQETERRRFLNRALGIGALALFGARAAQAASLTPDQKKKLKNELQRELERKVYAVDEALFRKVNRARNPKRLEGHERSHVPKIIAPKTVRQLEAFDVRIDVGVDEIHEMQVFHYVDWIGLHVGDLLISSTTVTPLFNRPIVTFQMTLENSATLTAREHCNLHGTWESQPVTVEVT